MYSYEDGVRPVRLGESGNGEEPPVLDTRRQSVMCMKNAENGLGI
mgnify:CR=1 FL=1